MEITEIKDLLKESNGRIDATIAALRNEVESTKSQDVLHKEKLTRIETDLAAALSKAQEIELKAKALETRLAEAETKAARPGGSKFSQTADEYKEAFVALMRDPSNPSLQQKTFDLSRKATDVRGTVGASGGFAVPEQIATDIVRQVTDISPIRGIARVVTVGTPDYKELVDLNGFGFEWVGETGARAQTDTPNIGEVAPTFGGIAAKPEASIESMQDLFFNVESWLADAAVTRFAEGEGIAFVSGDGTNKPTGFLAGPAPVTTADAARAFGTLQYVATGQAAALATDPFDTFKDISFLLKSGYRANSRWVMSSLTMAALAKLRDAEGRYLLASSVSDASMKSIEGYPITIAEDMPSIAANAFPVAFGDFSRGYLIADRAGMSITRDEVTKPGYVKWIMIKRVGGKLKDTNAIKLLKVAAA